MDRAEVVHNNFLSRLALADLPKRVTQITLAESGLTATGLIEIFESQILSRQLDRTSRKMQARGEGFYTIGSSGHEGNAAIAAAFKVDDMAFLHYRDAAFLIQRSKLLTGQTPTWDMLLSFSASADDPISGGRHKVLGSKALFIPPQTSTIASHLPKAVGAAYSVGLAKRHQPKDMQMQTDSIVLASFGDASANHSTSQGAFNTACWSAYQNVPMPIVFICEDNGIGISTKTPGGWIAANFSQRPALNYISCNGLDILDTYKAARQVEHQVRKHRKPAFLHMSCVRLYGHAGSDVQTAYISKQEVESSEANDPLLHSAKIIIDEGLLTAQQILDLYNQIGERVDKVAVEAALRPKLVTAKQVMAAIIPPKRTLQTSLKGNDSSTDSKAQREACFGSDVTAMQKPQHTARLLSWAISDLMMEHQNIVLAGEDIGPKGGVYNVTGKVHSRFGSNRVINTLLDEQSILGLAIGLAHNGFLPIPEIQFLAYLHNAEDQLRGEAATLSFFSNGQYTNPMIIRIAGLGYQKGFGGHFHNDNSLAVLRDIPGVIIACPSNGVDAVLMLRECVRLALEEQRIIVFVEPIALYMTRDLHAPEDGQWLAHYPQPDTSQSIALGDIGQFGDGTELAIVSYANGFYLSRQAELILTEKYQMKVRVIDLRWLAPLNEAQLLNAVKECGHVLVIDECRKTGSQAEAIISMLSEKASHHPKLRAVCAQDSFIPLGKAATVTLPSCDDIVTAALQLTDKVISR
ncbi:MAG: thiamine pyrophosphate-dependent enzyme [Oceanospirillaceae bacterium]